MESCGGIVSRQIRNGFPQNVWAATDKAIPVEAQLENADNVLTKPIQWRTVTPSARLCSRKGIPKMNSELKIETNWLGDNVEDDLKKAF